MGRYRTTRLAQVFAAGAAWLTAIAYILVSFLPDVAGVVQASEFLNPRNYLVISHGIIRGLPPATSLAHEVY